MALAGGRAAELLRILAEEGDWQGALRRMEVTPEDGRALLMAAAEKLEGPRGRARRKQALVEAAARAQAARSAEAATLSRTESASFAAPAPRRVRVYCDGASRGNPGPAGAGAVITDSDGRVLERLTRFLGRQTNNVAEYQGLLLGLEHAAMLGAREVEVFADSELLVRQMKGEYRVKNAGLRPLHEEARRRVAGFDAVFFRHIPREMNEDADAQSNRAIDERP
jgi:ribonuclease HI